MRIAAVLVVVVALAACGGGDDEPEAQETTTAAAERSAPEQPLDASKTHTVTLRTNKGAFTIELDVETSPNTTASFYELARTGFFDGTIIHRIVPGFVIQGGDPTGRGTGGPGYQTVDVPPSDAAYTKGVVAMAKTAAEPPGTSGSQFFVVTGADIGLPAEYAILGRVTDGLDVVEAIGQLGDPTTEQPTERIVIEKATVASE